MEPIWLCPYCGHEIDEHEAHCGEIGHAIKEEEWNMKNWNKEPIKPLNTPAALG